MIPRYSLPRMAALWDPEHRFLVWLRIEILACEAWAQLGKVPVQALEEIKARAPLILAGSRRWSKRYGMRSSHSSPRWRNGSVSRVATSTSA